MVLCIGVLVEFLVRITNYKIFSKALKFEKCCFKFSLTQKPGLKATLIINNDYISKTKNLAK